VRIAQKTAITTTSKAGVGSGVGGEVAVAASLEDHDGEMKESAGMRFELTQIRPAVQLSGTLKVREEPASASHPVGTSGVADPTFKSVKTAGL